MWYKSVVQEFLDTLPDQDLLQTYRRQDLLVRTLRDLYRHLSESSKVRCGRMLVCSCFSLVGRNRIVRR